MVILATLGIWAFAVCTESGPIGFFLHFTGIRGTNFGPDECKIWVGVGAVSGRRLVVKAFCCFFLIVLPANLDVSVGQ